MIVNIIVDTDFTLAFMQAMQSPDILCQRSMPGDRHRQEKGIQAGVIKAFADELAGCADYKGRITRCRPQIRHPYFHLRVGLTAYQHMNGDALCTKTFCQNLYMTGTLAEQQTASAFFDAGQDILDDQIVPQIIICHLIVILTDCGGFALIVKLETHAGKAWDHDVCKWTILSLLFCIHMVSDVADIHVKNRMMTILSLGRCS